MVQTTTYQTEDGATVPLTYTAKQSPVNYPARREEFCRLMATGSYHELEAYCMAWERGPVDQLSEGDRVLCLHNAQRLLCESQIRLRIDQLKTPVVRKYARKFEYTLQKAFEQCDEAYNLARIESDAKSMLKAIELQGKFAKLLAEQLDVNHRIGLLDETSTEVLLRMKAQLERKRQALEKSSGRFVEAQVIEVPEGGGDGPR